jgi:p38 MAP kinase
MEKKVYTSLTFMFSLSDVHQFSIITELLGTPPDDVVATICSENTLRFVQNLPKRERVPFSQRFAGQDEQAIDLLEKMLVFDPRKRINATEALAHPYLSPYHDPTDEPVAPEVFDWSFNDADLPIDTWKGENSWREGVGGLEKKEVVRICILTNHV